MKSITTTNNGVDHGTVNNLKSLMGVEALKSLIELFLQRFESNIHVSEGHIEKHVMEGLHFVAHSMKGSSGNMGCVDLALLCHQLDEGSKSADNKGLVPTLTEIKAQYNLSKQELIKFLSEPNMRKHA